MKLNDLTITQAHQGLIKKEFSALELTKSYLARIEIQDQKIFAFLSMSQGLALEQAKKADKMILEQGEKIPFLVGIPMVVKDNILVKDLKCTAGSKILENYIAPYDATVIKKLKDNGAIILGKTNMDEFGMGSSTENSAFFATKNPYDLSRVPGGTSGGSAAAVAADECIYALGSDTGGSIRQPAGFCGAVGLKPTYGAVSRYGLIAFASSLDQIGPITKTAEDAEIVFDTIKGKDKMDSTSVNYELGIKNYELRIKELRIGIPREYFTEGMDPECEKIIRKAIKECENLGIKIQEISLPNTKYALACYYIINVSEASANLARYDGIRFGKANSELKTPYTAEPFNAEPSAYGLSAQPNKGFKSSGYRQSEKRKTLLDVYLKNRGEGFGAEVKRRIMLGTYALSAGYYEAYYLKAQKIRTLIKQDFDRAFEKNDFIFAPTSPTIPFKLGEKTKDPLQMYLADIFTVPISLAGIPALSLPIGKAKEMPVGLQIIGKPFQEMEILKFASFLEKNICKLH